jgi:hypothetical protein
VKSFVPVDLDFRLSVSVTFYNTTRNLEQEQLFLTTSYITFIYHTELSHTRPGDGGQATDEVRGHLLSRKTGPAMAGELPTR